MGKKLGILVISVCICFMIGCQKNVMVSVNNGVETNNYKIPFENGLFYNEKGNQKILIKLFKDNFLFSKDTSTRIHIYIRGKQEQILKSNFEKSKIFFIKEKRGRCKNL